MIKEIIRQSIEKELTALTEKLAKEHNCSIDAIDIRYTAGIFSVYVDDDFKDYFDMDGLLKQINL